ncbi:MAG TPA: PP2C family protein-serine/threonine phosphatase [Phycisphaerales bacterium]|nr:PP2C family protein-serine/threonine phosphatase [Phycisphaerales bacterium]HMP37953.1 PP2C family protein-serine/threonine phosphatase [Phycisphaerales bacterium]
MTSASRQAASYRTVDHSGNAKIPLLMDLVRELSGATEPTEVQRIFARGFRQINPVDGYISLSRRGMAKGTYRITRMTLTPENVLSVTGNPWREFDSLPVHAGGILGEIIATDEPKLIHGLDCPDDPVLGDALAEFGSILALPLFDNGEALNWAITLRRDPEGFTVAELEESILRGNLVGGTVRTVVLTKRLREASAQIHQEVDRIARIQQALLPERMPEIAGVAIAARYETFDTAGGDLYGFRPLGGITDVDGPSGDLAHSPWAIFIADASGHGPAAAVVSAMLHAIVHAYPTREVTPAELLAHANHHLSAKRIEHSFVTAFAAVFDPRTRTLAYSRAGHEPPLVKQAGAGGAIFRLDAAAEIPLGILDEVRYANAHVVLEPGQTLVLYTDGITEAKNPGGEMFGTSGIERSLIACSGEPGCVIDSIMNAVRAHEAGRRPADDQTIVAMKLR